MNLLDPTYIRDICDYSFGDQSGSQMGIPMTNANINNVDFMDVYKSLLGKKQYMTLFIDNIRLYRRAGIKYSATELVDKYSRDYKDRVVAEYFKENDLLELCSLLPNMKFVIFSFFDDTPIDEFIYDKIPENVIAIYAANSISFGGKVHPVPYGIQRKMPWEDNRHEILISEIPNTVNPSKLLYVNHTTSTNPGRAAINEAMSDKPWATVKTPGQKSGNDYLNYLREIKDHKFVICPSGNAIGCECHRDWEVLYMKRVPVVIRSEYLEKIFEGFPVLMVDDFLDITEEMLIQNDHLYQKSTQLDLNKLDIKTLYDNIIIDIENKIGNDNRL